MVIGGNEESGYKYNYIAEKLNLSRAGLFKKINNITEFKASEIVMLSDLLKLSPAERDDIFLTN